MVKVKKPNADKSHMTYSTRDIFREYRSHYKKSSTKVDRVTWNLVIDSIIAKLKRAILVDKQIYKPRGGIGLIRMAKKENHKKIKGMLKDHYFFMMWDNRKPYLKSMKWKDIYVLKPLRVFDIERRNHINEVDNDPYQRDYNVPFA